MHEPIRDAILGAWGRSVARYPRITLGVCLLLALGSIALTAARLEFHADRSELIDADLSWNRRYAQFKESFPRWDDVLVCVEGDAGDPRVDDAVRRLAETLVESPRVVAADAGFDTAQAGPRFFLAAPPRQFAETLKELAQARRLAKADNVNAALATALSGLNDDEAPPPDALDRLEQFLDPYLDALEGNEPSFSFLTASRWQPLVSETGTGRLRFVRVQFAETNSGIDQTSENLAWLREQVDRLEGPLDLSWGVTGIPAIEADETAQSIRDASLASVIAMVLITLLMLVVFRGVRVPLLAAGSLLVGMAWSFGWLIISVGHLQLLSVIFSVILLGLGVDFALHLVARLELVQDEHDDLPSATARVFRGIGPGMVTGALTTAAAFASTALTDFKGMAEMGIIAAGGIVLCMVAVLSAFPAGLALIGDWKRIIRRRPGGESAQFAHGWLNGVEDHPLRVLILCGVVVIGFGVGALQVQYDPNVLNLQPPGIESVIWEKRLVEEDERSVWAALLVVTPTDAEQMIDRLRALDVVAGVGGMGILLPKDRAERRRQVAELRRAPVEAVTAAPGIDDLVVQLATIRIGLATRSATQPPAVRARLAAVVRRIAEAGVAYQRMSPPERAEAWSSLDETFLGARDRLGGWLEQALAPVPVGADDLPEVLRRQWVGTKASWLLMVHPAVDRRGRSILHPDRLGPFVDAVRGAVPDSAAVIGPPVQIYESSKLIKTEYIKAAGYAIAAILLLLFLDFRSLPDALCAMAPVAIGFVGVFGLMGLIGHQLNFANMIVLPIIFGIGAGTGVHIVHRWRAEPHGKPAGLSGGTGRAITLTMVTTMIGFGCMLLAQHRGIRSLGLVMVMGLGVTLLACYTVLPAILRLRPSGNNQRAANEPRDASGTAS